MQPHYAADFFFNVNHYMMNFKSFIADQCLDHCIDQCTDQWVDLLFSPYAPKGVNSAAFALYPATQAVLWIQTRHPGASWLSSARTGQRCTWHLNKKTTHGEGKWQQEQKFLDKILLVVYWMFHVEHEHENNMTYKHTRSHVRISLGWNYRQ